MQYFKQLLLIVKKKLKRFDRQAHFLNPHIKNKSVIKNLLYFLRNVYWIMLLIMRCLTKIFILWSQIHPIRRSTIIRSRIRVIASQNFSCVSISFLRTVHLRANELKVRQACLLKVPRIYGCIPFRCISCHTARISSRVNPGRSIRIRLNVLHAFSYSFQPLFGWAQR